MKENWSKHLRPMFKYIESEYDLSNSLVGVELGIKSGRNAYYILTGIPIKMLYLVDCYVESQIRTKSIMQENILDVFPNQTTFIYKKSVDAINDIPDNLDFVYIDSDHTYDTTRDEIRLYYPKIKIEGILGGHDYTFGGGSVKKAVDEFVEKNKLYLYTKYDALDPYSLTKRAVDWWIMKQ